MTEISFKCGVRSYQIDLEKDGYDRDDEQNGFRYMHSALYKDYSAPQSQDQFLYFLKEFFFNFFIIST
jgi:hypothetical protein